MKNESKLLQNKVQNHVASQLPNGRTQRESSQSKLIKICNLSNGTIFMVIVLDK